MSATDVIPEWVDNTDHTNCSLQWLNEPEHCTSCGRVAQVYLTKDPMQLPYCLDCGIDKAL